MKYDNWYAVQTAALCEHKAKKDIIAHRIQAGDTHITDVEVPESTELVVSSTGKKKIKKNKLLHGYILVRVDDEKINEEGQEEQYVFPTVSHDIIMSTPNVIGFAGANRKKPIKLGTLEVETLFAQVDTSHLEVKTNVLSNYEIGNSVEIISGPFSGTMITIDSIQSDKICTTIDICGRMTKLELNVNQVYKKS